jgi:phage-related protein
LFKIFQAAGVYFGGTGTEERFVKIGMVFPMSNVGTSVLRSRFSTLESYMETSTLQIAVFVKPVIRGDMAMRRQIEKVEAGALEKAREVENGAGWAAILNAIWDGGKMLNLRFARLLKAGDARAWIGMNNTITVT